jgi:hypothetical protein
MKENAALRVELEALKKVADEAKALASLFYSHCHL